MSKCREEGGGKVSKSWNKPFKTQSVTEEIPPKRASSHLLPKCIEDLNQSEETAIDVFGRPNESSEARERRLEDQKERYARDRVQETV